MPWFLLARIHFSALTCHHLPAPWKPNGIVGDKPWLLAHICAHTHTDTHIYIYVYSLVCSVCRHWIAFKEFILHAKRVGNARWETRSALVFVFTTHTHIPMCVCVCAWVRVSAPCLSVCLSVCLRVCWITRFKNNFVDFLIFYCAYQIRIQAEIPKRRQNASLTHTHTHTHMYIKEKRERERETDRWMHVLLSVACWFRDFSSHVACDVYEYISQLAMASRRARQQGARQGVPPWDAANAMANIGLQRAPRNQHAKLYFIDSKLTVIYVCHITSPHPTQLILPLLPSLPLSCMQAVLLCTAIEGP